MSITLTAQTIIDRNAAGGASSIAQANRAEFIELCESIAERAGHAAVELVDAAWAERKWNLWD